jgi:DNA-binding MarR family transcriptional regulator
MSTLLPISSQAKSHSAEASTFRKSRELLAADLAEALFQTTHALKYMGQQFLEDGATEVQLLSFPQMRVMRALDDADAGRIRMGELSVALGVTARNVTTIVDALEREGLVARMPDPKDRRAILLALTPKGQEHIASVHALHYQTAERFFAALDTAERDDLLRLLNKILEARRAAGEAIDCP